MGFFEDIGKSIENYFTGNNKTTVKRTTQPAQQLPPKVVVDYGNPPQSTPEHHNIPHPGGGNYPNNPPQSTPEHHNIPHHNGENYPEYHGGGGSSNNNQQRQQQQNNQNNINNQIAQHNREIQRQNAINKANQERNQNIQNQINNQLQAEVRKTGHEITPQEYNKIVENVTGKNPQNSTSTNQNETPKFFQVKVNPSGSVQIGTVTYIGNSVIPQFGITANEYSRKLKRNLEKAGKLKPENSGKVVITIKYPLTQKSKTSTSTNSTKTKSAPIHTLTKGTPRTLGSRILGGIEHYGNVALQDLKGFGNNAVEEAKGINKVIPAFGEKNNQGFSKPKSTPSIGTGGEGTVTVSPIGNSTLAQIEETHSISKGQPKNLARSIGGKVSYQVNQIHNTLSNDLNSFGGRLAIEAAVGALFAVFPEAAIPVSVALATLGILNRNNIIKSGIKHPVETAISLGVNAAAFGVGSSFIPKGEIATNLVNKIEGIETIGSGATRNRITNLLQENYGLSVLKNAAKDTSTKIYEINLKDGRNLYALQFAKAVGVPDAEGTMTGDIQTIILETKPTKNKITFGGKSSLEGGEEPTGRLIIARGAQKATQGKAETLTEAYLYHKGRSIPARIITEPKINSFKIGETTTSNTKNLPRGHRLTTISSESSIINQGEITGDLAQEIRNIGNKINKGIKIQPQEIRDLINLKRRFEGEPPFTKSEFTDADAKALTQGQILDLFKNAKAIGQARNSDVFRPMEVGLNLERRGNTIENFKTTLERFNREMKNLVEDRNEKVEAVENNLNKKPKTISEEIEAENNAFQKQLQENPKKTTTTNQKAELTPSLSPALPLIENGVKATKNFFQNAQDALSASIKASLLRINSANPQVVKNKEVTSTKNKQNSAQSINQAIRQSQNQFQQQIQKLNSGSAQRTNQSQSQNQKTEQRTNQQLQQQQKTEQRFREQVSSILGHSIPPKPKEPHKKKPKHFSNNQKKSPQKKINQNQNINKNGKFDVYIKVRGKYKKFNNKPFIDYDQARDFGTQLIAQNIRASVVIRPTKAKGIQKLTSQQQGFYKRNKNEFRKSKTNKRVIVEKKRYRLNTPLEKKQIKSARKRAKS